MVRLAGCSLLALSASALLLVTAGLGSTTGEGGTLRVMVPEDVRSLDPAVAATLNEWTIAFATCAKLFNYPDESGAPGTRLTPEVVQSTSVSKDARTYTFQLKRSFRFHTGAPVTARSFADALNRDASPRMNSPATQYMHEIVGADAVMQGKAETISGVGVLAPYRLRILLTRPLGDFTARLTMPYFCPIPPGTPIDAAGVENPAGSGPYYVAERVRNRRIVLERNRYYRGGRPSNPDRIVWTVEPDRDTRFRATEQDENDFVEVRAPNPVVRALVDRYGLNRPGGQLFRTTMPATAFFAFNHDRPAFKGPGQIPLEKAINYALDRPALARPYGLLGRRTDRLLPPEMGRGERVYPIAGADLATARRWLARARYKPSHLVLYAPSSPGEAAAAQVFSFNLRALGIEVEIRYPTSLQLRTRGEPYDVAWGAWGTALAYPDPAAFFVPLLYGRSLERNDHANLSYFDDPEVDARIDAASRLTGEARGAAWADLEDDLMRDDPPIAPYIHYTSVDLVSPSLGCYLRHPVYGVDLAAVCKK